MNILYAINSLKKFKRPHWDYSIQYFIPNSGPYTNLVDCDYFVGFHEDHESMSTSIDLYASDISADDYFILEEN